MRSIPIVVLAMICSGGSLLARDVHVNNTAGDDRLTGKAADTLIPGNGPVRTIQRALHVARFGDRVVIANTGLPYRECVALEGPENSGSSTWPFLVEGNGAVLDGTARIPELAWKPAGKDLVAFQPPRISFQRLFLSGKPIAPQTIRDAAGLARLEPMQWCMLRQAIHFRPERDVLPSQYELAFSVHPVGITLYDVRNVVVRNLVIQGYRLDGVNAHDNAFDCHLQSVTSQRNGRSGISVGGASRLKLRNCQLSENGVTPLRTEGWSHTSVEQTRLDGEPTMDGGELSIDGAPRQRAAGVGFADSAPLHRP